MIHNPRIKVTHYPNEKRKCLVGSLKNKTPNNKKKLIYSKNKEQKVLKLKLIVLLF